MPQTYRKPVVRKTKKETKKHTKKHTKKQKGGKITQSTISIQALQNMTNSFDKRNGVNEDKLLNDIKTGNVEHGRFVVTTNNEIHDTPNEYIMKMFDRVEDNLARILSGCTDPLCLNGIVKIPPYRSRKIIMTHNTNPKKEAATA
jgi:hypothetical protein